MCMAAPLDLCHTYTQKGDLSSKSLWKRALLAFSFPREECYLRLLWLKAATTKEASIAAAARSLPVSKEQV